MSAIAPEFAWIGKGYTGKVIEREALQRGDVEEERGKQMTQQIKCDVSKVHLLRMEYSGDKLTLTLDVKGFGDCAAELRVDRNTGEALARHLNLEIDESFIQEPTKKDFSGKNRQ